MCRVPSSRSPRYIARQLRTPTQTEPLPAKHIDGYTQTKVEAEQLVFRYYRDFGVPVVVLRPGFVYGPRDHAVVPDLLKNLRAGQVRYPGACGRRASAAATE